MDWIEIARNGLIFLSGAIALAILVREGHCLWIERKEWKAIARHAVREAEMILKESRKR